MNSLKTLKWNLKSLKTPSKAVVVLELSKPLDVLLEFIPLPGFKSFFDMSSSGRHYVKPHNYNFFSSSLVGRSAFKNNRNMINRAKHKKYRGDIFIYLFFQLNAPAVSLIIEWWQTNFFKRWNLSTLPWPVLTRTPCQSKY